MSAITNVLGTVQTYDPTTGQGTIKPAMQVIGLLNPMAGADLGDIGISTFVQKGETIKVGGKYRYTQTGKVAFDLVVE